MPYNTKIQPSRQRTERMERAIVVGRLVLVFVLVSSGVASQYGRNRMESVIAVRRAGHTAYTVPAEESLPTDLQGFIAVLDCDRLGEIVWLQVIDPKSECYPDCPVEKHMAVDCSGHAETTTWMRNNNIIAEVSWGTAERWGTPNRGILVREVVPTWAREYDYD